jgi:hypothetical protein
MFLKIKHLKNPKKLRKHIRKQIQKDATQEFVDKFIVIADAFGWSWYNLKINKRNVEAHIEHQVFEVAESVGKALPQLLDKDDYIRFISSGRIMTYFSDYDEELKEIEIELASSL